MEGILCAELMALFSDCISDLNFTVVYFSDIIHMHKTCLD